jgi:hypothetical protein
MAGTEPHLLLRAKMRASVIMVPVMNGMSRISVDIN